MQQVYIVIGLGFGDEGKGATVDYLAHKHSADLVVRFNGGAQAAHNVVTPDGKQHTFSQFGSGTFAGAKTHLSQYMVVSPTALISEAAHLRELGIRNPYELMSIDGRCLVTTPYHAAYCMQNETKHGTTGVGVGETLRFSLAYPDLALRISDLKDRDVMRRKLTLLANWHYAVSAEKDPFIQSMPSPVEHLTDIYEYLARILRITNESDWQQMLHETDTIIMEGAQGVMLDPVHGFAPYVTSTDCTDKNARALLEGYDGKIETIGCTRLYQTRHGVGTFPTEVDGLVTLLPETHNTYNEYQGHMRIGWLDLPMLRNSLNIVPCDYLAMSHLDCWELLPEWKLWMHDSHYETFDSLRDYLRTVMYSLDKDIRLNAFGETRKDRTYGLQAIPAI